MAELIQKIQEMTTEVDVSVPNLLRQCKILADKMDSRELAAWSDRELCGYKKEHDLPKYRIVDCDLMGIFSHKHEIRHGIHGSLKTLIHASSFMEEHRASAENLFFRYEFRHPIAGIVKMTCDSFFHFNIDAKDINEKCGEIHRNYRCAQAYQKVNMFHISGMIDTVKTKVLGFCRELGKIYPEDEKKDSFEKIAPQVKNIYYNIIMGDVGNLAQSSPGTVQTANIVQAGDIESLKKYLSKIGLSDTDIGDLEQAIQADSVDNIPKMGDKIMQWLEKIMYNASTEMLQKGTVELAKHAIQIFLGGV